MGKHGAAARPDAGRCFSTLLTSVPGAASQEQRLQHAPGLQCALAHSWHSSLCPSRAAELSPNSCSAHLPGRTEGSFPQVCTLKTSINISQQKYHISFQRAAEEQPTHPPVLWAGGTFWVCFANEGPEMAQFGSQQAWKPRPALWPSVQERQEAPALPAKHKGPCDALK